MPTSSFALFHSLRGAAAAALLCLGVALTSLFPQNGALAAAPGAGPEAADRVPFALEALRHLDPSGWKLGAEASHLYYYLLLSQGLSENSHTVITYALKGLLKLDPSLPVYQDGATILLARGEYAEAEKLAKEGLKRFSGDPLLTLLLSGAYSENEQLPKAVALLENYLKANPDGTEVMEELVRLYIRDKQDKKAAELISRMPSADLNPQSELFRASVLSTVGRVAEAREVLHRLLEKTPDLFEAWIELGFMAERAGDNAEALKAYDKAAEIAPDNSEIWYRIVILHLAEKQPEQALAALEKAPPSASLYMQTALRFADAKYYKEAELLLEKARNNGTSPEEAALFMSMLRQEASDDPKAGLADLETIQPDSPLYPAALEQKARIFLLAKEYDKARKVAGEARKQYPDHKEFWGLESYALVKLKKVDEAEKLLKDALAKSPGDEDLLFSLGSVQDESGKKEAAMNTMEELISVNPKNYQALNYVGYSLAEADKSLNRALTLINAAVELRPDADYIVDSLAWVQYRLGRFDEAWENINRCISLGGDDATIWEHYGDIALALGKKKEAAKGYSEAIKREPDNAAELRKKLAGLGK